MDGIPRTLTVSDGKRQGRLRYAGTERGWFRAAMRRGIFALLASVAGSASAAPAKVALVHDQDPSPLQQRTLTRLRAELAVAGFEVTDIERRGEDAREAAEAEPAAGVFATIAIVARAADAADIWVADRITGKTVVRRVQGPPSAGRDVASILAVRAVELLRASLLEALEPPPREEPALTAAPAPSPPAVLPGDVSAWMQAGRPGTEARFGLQAGVGVLHSFGGIGPAFLPVLGLSYHLMTDLSIGLRAGGPGFASDIQAPVGSIAVRQELANVEIIYELPLSSASVVVRPVAIVGGGAYHLDVVGTASTPYKGETGDLFAALFDAGAGAKFRFGERVSLLADLRLLLVAPHPVVFAAKEEVGSMSRPSLFGEAVIDVAF